MMLLLAILAFLLLDDISIKCWGKLEIETPLNALSSTVFTRSKHIEAIPYTNCASQSSLDPLGVIGGSLANEDDCNESYFAKYLLPSEMRRSIHTDSAELIKLQMHGTTTLAFVHQDSIVIAVDSKASIGDFVGSRTVKKIIPITSYITATMAGGAADCMHLLKQLRAICKEEEFRQEQQLPVLMVARLLEMLLQRYQLLELTVGTMVCGWDRTSGPSLFYLDSSGTMLAGKFFAVGSGATFAHSVLESQWDSLQSKSIDSAIDSAVWAVRHATHRDAYSGGYINVAIVNSSGFHHVVHVNSKDLHIP